MRIKYLNVCFIRQHGRNVERGTVADRPFDAEIVYVEPFIVVKIDAELIPEGLENNPTVKLKLDELMLKYPSTTEQYEDEEGNSKTRTIYGYFHEEGNSGQPWPIITMENVTYE